MKGGRMKQPHVYGTGAPEEAEDHYDDETAAHEHLRVRSKSACICLPLERSHEAAAAFAALTAVISAFRSVCATFVTVLVLTAQVRRSERFRERGEG